MPLTPSRRHTQERFETEILQSDCFKNLRRIWPRFGSRLMPVEGDISLPNFGIAAELLAAVQRSVSVVFHCAATVKFNEHLQTAIKINVDGVRHLLGLIRSLHRVDAVVHVSTAFVSHPGGRGASILEVRRLSKITHYPSHKKPTFFLPCCPRSRDSSRVTPKCPLAT